MADRLLFVTQVAPYADGPAGVHGVLDQAAVGVAQVAEMHGLAPARVSDVRGIDPSELRDARALALFTIGETPWSAPQRSAILDAVRAGTMAVVSIHSATDSCYGWDEYGALVGARFDGHPWTQTFTADVLDVSHPACAHLGTEWRWHDEVYQFRDLRDDADVLLRVRAGELDLDAPGAAPPGFGYPLAWCFTEGRGRVFSTSLGHFPGAWELPVVPPASFGRPRMGARRGVSRSRNFSNWAYWRLQHESTADADPCPLDDPAQIESWRTRVRNRLDAMLGPSPEPVPLDLEVTETVDCGTYRRERVVFDTEATMSVPAYLLVPHERTAPGPALLAIHGHGPGKARICGVTDETHDEGPAYADELADDGYVVLAPDLRGFGERAEWMPAEKYHCDWDLVCATMAGVVPHARNLWDMQRSLDVLAAHPLVDADRIGACGLSYGATCTLTLAAIDDRVRAAIVACYLSSWRSAHTVPWNMCGSQILPGQIGAIEHLDVAALIAPRPVLAENGTDDVIFPVAAARATVASLREVYAHLGAPPDAVVHDVFVGGHQWHGTETSAFLERWL